MRNHQQSQESSRRDAVRSHNEHPSDLFPICNPGESNHTDDSECIHRHCEQLCHSARVSQIADDGGCRVCEAIYRNSIAEPDDDGEPDLPLRERGFDG